MQIMRFGSLQETPWKNGKGITREIAAAHRGDVLCWRLSIADVATDAPFSGFEGLQRILTVVEGHGMALIGPQETLHADYAAPLAFDGGLEIEARLKRGPVQDFNLIYDPKFCTGKAEVISVKSAHARKSNAGELHAIHCIEGVVSLGALDKLYKADTAVYDAEAFHFDIAENAIALVITVQTTAKS